MDGMSFEDWQLKFVFSTVSGGDRQGILGMARTASNGGQAKAVVNAITSTSYGKDKELFDRVMKLLKFDCLAELFQSSDDYDRKQFLLPFLLEKTENVGQWVGILQWDDLDNVALDKVLKRLMEVAQTLEDWKTIWVCCPVGSDLEKIVTEKINSFAGKDHEKSL